MKNDRVESRFVAAEVARDVRHDVRAGTPALKALRMIVSLAAPRDGKHRPRSIVFYDITTAFVQASMDEVVGVVPHHHRDPAGTCGCHGDCSMTEGSDALLDRLDRAMKDDFDAKMLGRVGRGQLTEVKFLKRTVRWHEQEMCFSWSGGTRYVIELAVMLGLTDTRAATKTRTPGTKATGGGARCSGTAGYLSGS